MQIGSSTYSFRRLTNEITAEERDRTILGIIDEAPRYGLTGLELLAIQFESDEPQYINEVKRRAVLNGLDLYALSIHNNFVKPDPNERRAEMDKALKWIDVAYRLGVPIMRLFGGRWDTVGFMELMAQDGLEEPLPGYRYEDAIEWNIECFTELTKRASDLGIILAIENHWGITYSADGVLDIVKGVDSPWFKVIMDCGNFRVNTYEQLAALAPHTVLVHIKSYQGGGLYYDFEVDYGKVFDILKDVNYNGYLSLEYEGRDAPSKALPPLIEEMERLVSSNK